MKLLKSNDLLLKQVSQPFDFQLGHFKTESGIEISAEELYIEMKNKMMDLKTLGLSAPQFGVMVRMFVIGNPEEPDNIMPVFNPTIVNFDGPDVTYEEQCSTFPGLFLKIKRKRIIRMRYANYLGEVNTHNFDGITSRVIQHEVDHLNGILFTERANRFHMDQAKRRKLKMDRVRKANDRQAAL